MRRKVIVRTLRDGREQIEYRGRKLRWRALPGRPERAPLKPVAVKVKVAKPPGVEHPWRRFGMAVGREYWREVKGRARAVRAAAGLGLGDSSRPALRSGLPPSPNPNPGTQTKNNPQRRGHSLKS